MVIPFAGTGEALADLVDHLRPLRLGTDDALVIVDNNPRPAPAPSGTPTIVHAPGPRTPGYARNRGVERGSAPWLLFLDADVLPPPELLDRYFQRPPGERTALLAGGMVDEPIPDDGPAAARYAYIRSLMSQEDTFRFGSWGYPKSANLLCRREAFEAVGGFREDIRAAEDADLTYRLKAAGWGVERREDAAVVHRSRQTLRAFVSQKAMHGAGAAWLCENYPGVFPARRRPGLVWWGVRTAAKRLVGAARSRDRDEALWGLFEPLEQLTFEFGRSLPNERPLRGRRRPL